ncbi:FUSC family protein [Streptomyces sp. NRRL F-2664]|uniref:FUSC family protein n=1 Tax=Streptomyces sp. NRRL F-2664 TaxID=1463842 RepID=UPI0004CB9B85|nr:FUSC family protein [Streptomyces sp. NRRL F-2664]
MIATEGPAAARIVVTVAAAWETALWLGAEQPPVYAAIVPLVALRGDPMTALATSLQRVLGVVAGVFVGIAVLNFLHPSTAAIILVLAVGLATGMVLRAGGSMNVQVPASSLLVFASTSPDAYALHRLWETGAGAAVTILLAPLLWPPDPRRTLAALAADSRTRLIQALTSTTTALGTDPGTARDNLASVTSHIEAIHSHAVRAREAERAMRFNPLRRRNRETVTGLARVIATADQLTAHLATLAREVSEFTGRDDLDPVLPEARRYLPGLAASTAKAITDTLHETTPQQAQTAARANLAAYARADRRPAATALRRPFKQILDDLEQHFSL